MDFALTCNEKRYVAKELNLIERDNQENNEYIIVNTTYKMDNFCVVHYLKSYKKTNVVETWFTVKNTSNETIKVERLDSFHDTVSNSKISSITYFESGWGREYQPHKTEIEETLILENRLGRSSAKIHPFVLLETNNLFRMIAIAWSGNWVMRFEKTEIGILISGGLSDWEFYKVLDPGEQMDSIHILDVQSDTLDLNDIANQFNCWGMEYWYPKNELLSEPLVEWNHWWTYEDTDINENIFKENVKAAQSIGIDVCTLDAGWFGPSQPNSEWFDWRGDWHLVNDKRFPSGIRVISDEVHSRNMKFGLWCEIEGLGKMSTIGNQQEYLVAKRSGEHLGYICFGNPKAQEWAINNLDRLIIEYNCDWIKLDFNLDPKAGCNREDHGHGCGDGLYEHYLGYYRVLDQIRKMHPHVILENCSSGGLRTDLGIMKHNHLNFLSDPDYSLHGLQVFWAASLLLHPSACLHWMWSKSKSNDRGEYAFPPLNLNHLNKKELAFHLRVAMLHRLGFSQPLPDWKEDVKLAVKKSICFYKETVFPFVHCGGLYRLTDQTNRNGSNKDGWSIFQYVLPEQDKSLVFIFSLETNENPKRIMLKNLKSMNNYRITNVDHNCVFHLNGSRLMEAGIVLDRHIQWESTILLIEKE
jgi:alpha-galactosidase